MRGDDFVPCNCNKCYFCVNGHYTSGIAHTRRKRAAAVPIIEYKCNTCIRTEECLIERVNLGKGSSYCKMCYRLQDECLTGPEKWKECRSSRCGCVIYKDMICTE